MRVLRIEKAEKHGRRQRYAMFALNELAGGCHADLDCGTIFWSRDLNKQSACSRTSSMGPAMLWSASALLPHSPMDGTMNAIATSRKSRMCMPALWPAFWPFSPATPVYVLTFLSHFAFAFAQCTHAIGMRSVGESMFQLVAIQAGVVLNFSNKVFADSLDSNSRRAGNQRRCQMARG